VNACTDEIRVLIVDDEAPARQRIADLLRRDAQIGALHEASNGETAVRMILGEHPDLVLLDVQMPGLTGIEVIETVGPENMPPTVFVTAYDQHAIHAFDTNALDYLLKPFSDERFDIMIARFKQRRKDDSLREFGQRMMAMVAQPAPAQHYLDRFAIKYDGTIRFIRVKDIVWIEAAGVYVTLHAGGEKILYRTSLNELERNLDPSHFLRIHRAVIVNIDSIVQLKVRSHGEFEAVLQDGTTLRVSRTYREALERRLKQKL
jgi:two-component system LytT family response regulator